MKETTKRLPKSFPLFTISLILLNPCLAIDSSINRVTLADNNLFPIDLKAYPGHEHIIIGIWIKAEQAGVLPPPVGSWNPKTSTYYGLTYEHTIDEN